MNEADIQKKLLVQHLNGGLASVPISDVINEIPFDKLGERPNRFPYSFYEVFYHITFAQKDILEYCESQDYQERQWPLDYWPKSRKPNTKEEWEELKKDYLKDRENIQNFILQPNNHLSVPVKNSNKHSLLREILLVLEHNSYHTGQLVVLQRLLGFYKN